MCVAKLVPTTTRQCLYLHQSQLSIACQPEAEATRLKRLGRLRLCRGGCACTDTAELAKHVYLMLVLAKVWNDSAAIAVPTVPRSAHDAAVQPVPQHHREAALQHLPPSTPQASASDMLGEVVCSHLCLNPAEGAATCRKAVDSSSICICVRGCRHVSMSSADSFEQSSSQQQEIIACAPRTARRAWRPGGRAS